MKILLPSKFTGIIQAMPADESGLLVLQAAVLEQYNDQQPNPKLHITLLHQSFLKKVTNIEGLRGDKALKALFKNGGQMGIPTPNLQLGDVKMGFDLIKDRRSSYVEINNPEACIELRNAILESAGLNPSDLDAILTQDERNRVFHVSLTNLEGNSGSSIAYPQASDRLVVIR
jgi:hypothetical protein